MLNEMKDNDAFWTVGIHMSVLSFQGSVETVVCSVMAAYHAQACYAALHRVVLKVYFKVFHRALALHEFHSSIVVFLLFILLYALCLSALSQITARYCVGNF